MSAEVTSMEECLRREFIEPYILEKMNPSMGFLGMFKPINLYGSTTFEQYVDEVSAEDDIKSGVLSKPEVISEESRLHEIKVSPISSIHGDTKRYGFSFRISDLKSTRENKLIEPLIRYMDAAAYSMSRMINYDFLNTMVNYAKANTITLNDGSWKISNMISEDIVDMQEAFDIKEYNYELTDMFVGKPSWYGAKKYWKALNESFTPEDCEGSAMHKVTEYTKGLVGLDLKIKPLSFYYNINEKYSSVKGSIVNVDVFQEQASPKDHIVEMWMEYGIGVKHPKAMLWQEDV